MKSANCVVDEGERDIWWFHVHYELGVAPYWCLVLQRLPPGKGRDAELSVHMKTSLSKVRKLIAQGVPVTQRAIDMLKAGGEHELLAKRAAHLGGSRA